MKKLFILLVVMLSLDITNASAQNEVRGVETKLVTYTASNGTEYFGYEFYNMNSIPVSVDAELYCFKTDYGETILKATKSFVLNSKEKYIWKHENNSNFEVQVNQPLSQYRRDEPWGTHHDHNGNYHIKYKAYKLE